MKKSKFLTNCLALFVITLVAGIALAFVNEITKEPIAAAEDKARLEAYNIVYTDASFETIKNDGDLIKKSTDVIADGCTVDDILTAKNSDGENIGYVMSVTSPSGYGGNIQIALGISSVNNSITGFSVLSQSETAGLGSKCTEEKFMSQFKNKSASEITYTKNGASADNEIDAISGATITTNAVTEAVNSALAFYNEVLVKEGVQ